MNIVLSCDENYSPYLAVNLLSILKNTKSTINFYILDLGIAFESKSKILEIVNKNNSNIEFIGVDKKDFLKFPSTISHISIATYARLKIDHYLPALDKVIYLDVDTLVINDLTPLWNVDLDGCVVGACIDSYVEFGLQGYKYNIGLTDKDVYFNAGVLLIDLLKFKSLDVYNRAISFLQKYPNIEFQDQDILNFILKEKSRIVDPAFNFMPTLKNRMKNREKLHEYEKLDRLITVIHYCSNVKPWGGLSNHIKSYLFDSLFREIKDKPIIWNNRVNRINLLKRISLKIKDFRNKTIYKIKY
ncbi:hypothetical protein B0186_09645 [Canicola haemoglobinophilus]|uniref:1,4-alpha-galactosyltransferase (LgtC) n=2 Tax=Canicola haemoglobinophilus TaxID=733 RepID=A0A1V4AZ42_9PAST|nr:glycosyltransferase family 8 protein [Canicola haemoglobinophilus]OOR98201.1 hypothetical protein B0186_09645 [Canicola haemoglobinophilus]STO58962.1 1,4-alpha-galactosyltransferase (LgtC) [Canicola haemoglobinophilus]